MVGFLLLQFVYIDRRNHIEQHLSKVSSGRHCYPQTPLSLGRRSSGFGSELRGFWSCGFGFRFDSSSLTHGFRVWGPETYRVQFRVSVFTHGWAMVVRNRKF